MLSDMSVLETVEAGNDFAEKLGLWVGFDDAIILRAAHNDLHAGQADMPSRHQCVARDAIGKEITRVRTNLVQAIAKRPPASGAGARIRIGVPIPNAGVSFQDTNAYGAYRGYHLAHQREIERHVRPLRAKVRSVLAMSSPALRKIADMDAAFDRIFSERESELLSTIPSLMEKRFKQLQRLHQLTQVDIRTEDSPSMWMTAGGWLARFCGELQNVLIAEVDFRLQPAEGLMDALNNRIENRNE